MKMKKTVLSLIAACSLSLVSCDMDLKPYDGIDENQALSSVTDFKNMRVGMYASLRGRVSGGNVTLSEFQADNFNAVVGFSNTYGDMYRWQFTSNTGSFDAVYAGYQGMIGKANFILTNKGQLDINTLESKDSALVEKIIGEAYFFRAFSIFQLSQYFCAPYDAATASQAHTGVSYSLVYSPSSDASTYPGRYTMEQTFAQIASDIEAAKSRIKENGAVASAYITKDVITALEARVALAKKDYATAVEKAKSLISAGTYALCADGDELKDMWYNDGGAEAILQIPVPSKDELPGQNGVRFLPYQDGSVPDYLPTQEFVNLFEAGDARAAVYFKLLSLNTTSGASGQAYAFNKFPDESGLWEAMGKTEAARFTSEPKPFRLAEMYLIAAEACAMSGQVTEGAKYLNALKSKRIAGYKEVAFSSANDLMSELKAERRRELAGEGFRLLDLKRWNEGVVRGEPQNLDFCLFPGSSNTTNLVRAAGDSHMTWPIPQSEMNANPQMKQNPGY